MILILFFKAKCRIQNYVENGTLTDKKKKIGKKSSLEV